MKLWLENVTILGRYQNMFHAYAFHSLFICSLWSTVRIRFKKRLNKKDTRFKKDLLVNKMQIKVIDDSK